jgi:flagellar hook assembly protein FlgD
MNGDDFGKLIRRTLIKIRTRRPIRHLALTLMTCLLAAAPIWAASVEFIVDEKLVPQPAALPALPGGIGRTVVKARNPNGTIEQFVADEVILRPRSEDDLLAFLRRYDGKVLQDGSLPAAPEGTPGSQLRTLAPSPYRLVQVNLDRVDTSNLINDATALGAKGQFAFSSKDGLKLAALLFRSRREGIYIAPELIFEPHLQEHPDGFGGFLDPDGGCNASFPEVCDSTAQATKVNFAWEYVRLLGAIPQPNFIAIIDDGFAVASNGQQLFGNVDLPNTAFRWNFNTDTSDVSGTGWGCNPNPPVFDGAGRCWHATAVANVATAGVNNSYGTAGTGSPMSSPFLFKFTGTNFQAARAIRTAVKWGAQVVNASFGGVCDWWCDTFGDASGEGPLFDSVQDARIARVVVVASAGNSSTDLDTVYQTPCEIDHVICVGAMGSGATALNAAAFSNFGFPTTIWAPGVALRVAPFPTFNAANGTWNTNAGTGLVALGSFGGTSAASPFVAGVVGLMKSIAPLLQVDTVRQILWDTANFSSSDPKLVLRGSIEAFAAVSRAAGDTPVGQVSSPTVATNWWNSMPLSVTFCRGCVTNLSNINNRSSVQYRARYDKGDGAGRQDYAVRLVSSAPFTYTWNLTGLPRQPGVEIYASFFPVNVSIPDPGSPIVGDIGINVDTTPPQGQITSPLPNSVYGDSVPLSAQVSDTESGVDRVEFRVLTTNGWQTLLTAGTAANNFTVNWNTIGLSSQPVTIAARAIDRQNNATELAQITNVRIDHTAPAVTMLYPSPDSAAPTWITTNSLTTRVRVSDANGISEVLFYAWYREANGNYLRHSIGRDTAPDANGEYTNLWTVSTVPDQADRSWPFDLYVEAKAVDTSGNSSTAPGWIVGFDRTLPVPQITSPAGPTTYVNGGSVALVVQASDNLGVNGGQVTRLNVTARYREPNAAAAADHVLAALTNVTSWSGSLNVATLPEQTLSITAEAFDEAGNRNFVNKHITIDRTAPTASGLNASPNPFVTNGSRSMSFSYTPSEYANQVNITILNSQGAVRQSLTYTGVDTDPHVASWDGRNSLGALVPTGNYSYVVQITDQAGNIGTVNGGTFAVVTDTTAPALSVVVMPNPFRIAAHKLLNIRYTVNEAVRAEVEVLNSANQVVRYIGAQQVPGGIYTVVWNGLDATGSLVPVPGLYTARVRATDVAGNVTVKTASVLVEP